MRSNSNATGKLVGNIDRVDYAEVRGWAALQTGEGMLSHRQLQLEVADEILGTASADHARPDVAKALGGPDRVGFLFRLDDELLADWGGQAFTVRDVESGTTLSTAGLALPTMVQRTLIDIGDTLIFFQAHGISTGIQRVVTEVTRAIEGGSATVQLVAGAHDGSGVYSVDHRQWERLLRALATSATEAIATASEILEGTFVGSPIQPRDGDVLIVLGATWISELYLQSAIRYRQAGGRLIFMVYDLIPVRMPHMFDALLRTLFTRFLVTCSVVADGVLCISEYTRRDFENYCTELGLTPPATRVTRLASSLAAPTGKRRVGSGSQSWGEVGPAGYVLLVSTIEGRKGHAMLLRVWSRLLRQHGRDVVPDLIFVGRTGWNAQDVYSELGRTGYFDGKVHILSDVPDDELVRLYAGASFTVYPSTFEGWGLPVAESLTCGTPVIASDSTSIPEVGGDFVTYFQSGDERQLFDAVERWLTSPSDLKAAKEKLSSFRPETWQDVAASVVGLAKDISAQNGDHGFAPLVPSGQEIVFGTGALLEESSDFLDSSWQEQIVNATPVLQQAPHMLSNALGNLSLRGPLFEPEPNGRWTDLGKAMSIRLRVAKPGPVVVYLSMSSGDPATPALVSVRGDCRASSVWVQDSVLKLMVSPRATGEINLNLEVRRRLRVEDHRNLGIFLRSLVVLPADDFAGQLLVAETLAGVKSRGISVS